MNNCKKCGNKFLGNYCPNCGSPITLNRINGRYIIKEIESVLHFDKGILHTIRELILRPEISIRKFIFEDRNRLVKPIIFLILCSLIHTIIEHILHFEDRYINLKINLVDSEIIKTFDWLQNNYGYTNIFIGIFIGLWTKILFRKSGFNIYETLILIFYTMGIGILGYTFFAIGGNLTNLNITYLGNLTGIIYSTWAIGRFFNKNKISSYIKGFFSYLLGFLTLIIFIITAIIGFMAF